MEELSEERGAALAAIESMHLTPVMFEAGARAHPPHEVYRDYLAQSDLFVGIYWQQGGWIASGDKVSGLADEFGLSDALPRLIYVKEPAEPDAALTALMVKIRSGGLSYRHFETPDELRELLSEDLAALMTERFDQTRPSSGPARAPELQAPIDTGILVGRRRELTRGRRVLQHGGRILTLVGPGGIGKTTLATAIAADVAADYSDGVVTVELESARTLPDVLALVAAAMGVTQRDAELGPLLSRELARKHLLLVLDNLEQVVEEAHALTAVLRHAPGVQVLATSRVPLRLRGEQILQVEPLALPVRTSRRRSWRRAAAFQLFMDRAMASDPLFVPTDLDITDIADIVIRLDGIPLAIELAAARMSLSSPHAILGRLTAGLGLLSGGRRDSPDRHQTMHAAIDWSYQLLTAREKQVFRQLSVFDGGFTIAAASRIVTAKDDLLEVLASLTEKSLLRMTRASQARRLTMLQTIQEFARAAEDHALDEGEVRARHAEHFLGYADSMQGLLRSRPSEAVSVFRVERRNFLAALGHLVGGGDTEGAVKLAWAMWPLWYLEGRADEGADWFDRIVTEASDASAQTRAHALTGAGLLGLAAGRTASSRLHLASGLHLARSIGDVEDIALAGGTLGHLAAREGRLDDAERLLDESIALLDHTGDRWHGSVMRVLRAEVPLLRRQNSEAVQAYETALAEVRAYGDPVMVLLALYGLAHAVEQDGDLERAERLLTEGMSFGRSVGDKAAALRFERRRARVARLSGDHELADSLIRPDADSARAPWLDSLSATAGTKT